MITNRFAGKFLDFSYRHFGKSYTANFGRD